MAPSLWLKFEKKNYLISTKLFCLFIKKVLIRILRSCKCGLKFNAYTEATYLFKIKEQMVNLNSQRYFSWVMMIFINSSFEVLLLQLMM
jgi:hypothetical protein